MKALIVLALLSAAAFGQIRAGCTKDSIATIKSGSLAATALDRWSCYAQNIGTTTLTLSRAGFALDNPELGQVDLGDVTDIFNTKAAMSKTAKAMRVLEYAALGLTLVATQNYFAISSKAAAGLGLATYGVSKLNAQLAAQAPTTATDLAGLLSQDVTLQPGGSCIWKVYTSRPPKGQQNNVVAIGPRFLTMPIPVPAAPSAAAMASPAVSTQQYVLTPLMQGMQVQSGPNTIMVVPTMPTPNQPTIQDYHDPGLITPQGAPMPPAQSQPQPQAQPPVKPAAFVHASYEAPVAYIGRIPWLTSADICGL